MNREMFYRSSWELKVCEYLDREDNNVLEFYIEPFYIEYMIEDEVRYTRIDFHIKYNDGRESIVEVKPSVFVYSGNVPYKIVGCKKYADENGMTFVLITENELDNLKEALG